MWFTNIDTQASSVKIRIEASSLKDAHYRMREWLSVPNNQELLKQAHRRNLTNRNCWGSTSDISNPDIVIVTVKPGDNEPKFNLMIEFLEGKKVVDCQTYLGKTLLQITDILNECNEKYDLKLERYDFEGITKGYYYKATPKSKEEHKNG